MLGVTDEVGGNFLAGTRRDSGLEPVVERGRLEGETVGVGEPELARKALEGPLTPRPGGGGRGARTGGAERRGFEIWSRKVTPLNKMPEG